MKPLTSRQQQVLRHIRDYTSYHGYPPTLRDIAAHFGLSGPRAAVKHLEALQRKGYIRRKSGGSRCIEVQGPPPPSLKPVPVLGSVPAGPTDLAVQEDGETLSMDPAIAGEGTFFLRVRGDSMTGDHILPGDLILVQHQPTASNGDLVVALLGEEATLKRFLRKGNRVTLLPSNPSHTPIVMEGTGEETGEGIRIIGKVKAVLRLTGATGG